MPHMLPKAPNPTPQPAKTAIARWFCGRDGKLIGEGTQQCMEKAPGCAKWQKNTEIKEWNGK